VEGRLLPLVPALGADLGSSGGAVPRAKDEGWKRIFPRKCRKSGAASCHPAS